MKTIINDLKDQVTRMDQEHEEWMDCHREDISWQREECILLRAGLQENKDRTAELSVQGQQMSRWLCRCADRQGPPISAVGLPQPPPYARSPSPEFHTPPIEVRPIEDAETPPAQHSLIPVPPPVPKSPIPFSNAENIHLACYANPPTPRAPLQPIEEVVSDAKDSNVVVEMVGGSDWGRDCPLLPDQKQPRSRGSLQSSEWSQLSCCPISSPHETRRSLQAQVL